MEMGKYRMFSLKHSFSDIKNIIDKPDKSLIEAFKERVEDFYLAPVKTLNDAEKAFAAGVLSVSAIDFLARYYTKSEKVGERFIIWLQEYIPEFSGNKEAAERFYNDFRNGLVHEGRVKEGSYFTYKDDEFGELYKIYDGIMLVNPVLLHAAILTALYRYIDDLDKNDDIYKKFKEVFSQNFKKDLEAVD